MDDSVIQWIVEEGTDAAFGARPLRRYIQRYLETAVAKLLIGGTVLPGSKVVAKMEEDELKILTEKLVKRSTNKKTIDNSTYELWFIYGFYVHASPWGFTRRALAWIRRCLSYRPNLTRTYNNSNRHTRTKKSLQWEGFFSDVL